MFSAPRTRAALHTIAVTLSLILLIGLGAELWRSQDRSRDELLERFALRAEIGAKFLTGYVTDLEAKELAEAVAKLRLGNVSAKRFTRSARVIGFPAAVLLDEHGRLLAIHPSSPHPIGNEIASSYLHLTAAVNGHVAVSNVVPSAARGIPVVAFAVPFSTAAGLRVISGALSVAETTLGSTYLQNLVPIAGARVYLVDATRTTIASSLEVASTGDLMQREDRPLWEAIASADEGQVEGPHGNQRFAVAAVAGTPWRLVLSAPESLLLSPVSGASQWLSRLVFVALCIALGTSIALFRRLSVTRARQMDEIERLSVTDSLTGLYNRRGHELLATQVLRSGARAGAMISILFLDIDGLKRVNDERGHDIGDRLLISAADLFRETFRDTDVIARLGGDEFCVVGVTPGTPDDRRSLMTRLEENLARHNASRGEEPELSLSLGVSLSDPRNPRPLEELVREADERMYEEKRGRRAEQVPEAADSLPLVR